MMFYAPKSFKSGKLIFGRFRIKDLIFFLSCCAFSLVSCIIYVLNLKETSIVTLFIIFLLLLPSAIAFLLTMDFGVYHNIGEFLIEFIKFQFLKPWKYSWEGIYKLNDKSKEEK